MYCEKCKAKRPPCKCHEKPNETTGNKSALSAGLVALIAEWRELGEHWWGMSEKENNKPQKREFSGFAETFECCADMLEELTEKSN